MKLLNFPIIYLCLSLILGICLAEYFGISLTASLWITLLLLAALSISYVVLKGSFSKGIFFGILSFLTTISMGALIYNLHDERNQAHHYLQSDPQEHTLIVLEIRELLKPSEFNDRYVAIVKNVNQKASCGKLLLNVQKSVESKRFTVGTVLITIQRIEDLPKVLNPFEFNYAQFLSKRQVYKQIKANAQELMVLEHRKNGLYTIAASFRDRVNHGLKHFNLSAQEIAVINALLLGQRQDLDASVYNDYVNAGAVHILAVSGLHVGIIWLILSFLLKPLRYLNHGKLITGGIIISLLWLFALVAGFSPSVTRAVMMFSVITIAALLNRPTNIYNTLATSAIFILLYKPMFLFEVGFQMSYLAVIGIVSFRPAIIKLYEPRQKTVSYFYNILLVTLGAQLGVLPLSLFYFHQFPTLFFMSNLLIIPFMGIILGVGIVVIMLAYFQVPANLFVDLYGWVINLMNEFVAWVARQESFLLDDISFDSYMMLACYLSIVGLFLILKTFNLKRLSFFILSLLLMQATTIFRHRHHENNELIIFHKNRETIIGQSHYDRLTLYSAAARDGIEKEWFIKNYKVGSFKNQIDSKPIKPLYKYKDQLLFLVDSSAIYQMNSIQPDVVLLRDSPKVNLTRLIDSVGPELIVADGSNYRSYIERWKATCKKKNIPFHATGSSGALIFSEMDKSKKP